MTPPHPHVAHDAICTKTSAIACLSNTMQSSFLNDMIKKFSKPVSDVRLDEGRILSLGYDSVFAILNVLENLHPNVNLATYRLCEIM